MGTETVRNIAQINARHSSLVLCVSGVVLVEPLDIRSKIVLTMFYTVQGFLPKITCGPQQEETPPLAGKWLKLAAAIIVAHLVIVLG